MNAPTAVLRLLLLFFVLTEGQRSVPYPQQSLQESSTPKSFVEEQEQVVRRVADRVRDLHFNRKQFIEECSCSLLACSEGFRNMSCQLHLAIPMTCGTEGLMLDDSISMVRLPPGTTRDDLDLRLQQGICLSKHLDTAFKEFGLKVSGWTYFGSIDGHHRSYPARLDDRQKQKEDSSLGCEPYDPRKRPWYIAAITGPKDIVIVVDKSKSMINDPRLHGKRKWDITKKAVSEILDTFTFADFVNVVTFSNSAVPLWTDSKLAKATAKQLETIKELLEQEKPDGKTNFTAAFTTAFDLLTENCGAEPKICSNCQKIILFLTDGSDTSRPNDESIRPSQMMDLIEQLQETLEEETNSRAVIFTYSMTEQADDAIPRQIACANNGAWSFIGPNTNTLDALNSYSLYLAANRRSPSPVWTEPYNDFNGLGRMTTVAMPVFSKEPSGLLIGVVGHDVPLSESMKRGFSEEELLENITLRSERCAPTRNSACDLQNIRNERGESGYEGIGLCPDMSLPKHSTNSNDSSGLCYELDEYFYKRFSEETRWEKAKEQCEEEGGELVMLGSRRELAFLANLALPDGSWIGLRVDSQQQFRWLDQTADNSSINASYWAIAEPSFDSHEEQHCGAIDPRGVIHNLQLRPCWERLSFVCKYVNSLNCTSGVESVTENGDFVFPVIDRCSHAEDTVSSPQRVEIDPTNVLCDTAMPMSEVDAFCCPEEKGLNRTILLLLVVLGSIGFSISILCMAFFRFR